MQNNHCSQEFHIFLIFLFKKFSEINLFNVVANNSLSFLHNTVSQCAFFRGKKYYLPLSKVLRGKIFGEKKNICECNS